MPIPNTVADLSTTASSNYPSGSESANQIDDYHRALCSIVRQVSDAKIDANGATIVAAIGALPVTNATTSSACSGNAATASTASAIADGAVSTTAKIANNIVTNAKLARAGTSGQILSSGGAGSDPAWIDIDPLIAPAMNASGSAPMYACRAWVNFNGTGTVSIRASGNVSSITDRGVGLYTVNFTTAMPDADYAALCTGTGEGSTTNGLKIDPATPLKTTTALNIIHMGDTFSDTTHGNVAIFR